MRSTTRIVTSCAAGAAVALLAAAALPAVERARDAARMTEAATAFLSALSEEQRAATVFPLDSEERLRWHFIPTEMFERRGVMLEEMDDAQRARAHDLLRAGLSQRGYLTATQIMELEDVLLAREGGGRLARDKDQYHFSVFGTPGEGRSWAWRFEGHHISLHFTVAEGAIAVATPAFLGANPAEVREGPLAGRRALGDREDAARALLESLDDEQRAEATIAAEAPRDILTGAELEIDPLTPPGIAAARLDAGQRDLLMALIDAYASTMAEDLARARLERVRAGGVERITFAWAGGYERGAPHYYRVQGPAFLIEYDNTQNDANHIHSVWRDFDGDFGRDLLREHLERHPH